MLPHQIILLWGLLTCLGATFIAMLITFGRRPLYLLANIFFGAFIGFIAGGIFVDLTKGLEWALWSLMIPPILGGIVGFFLAVFLYEKLPSPTKEMKPIAGLISIIVLIMLSMLALMPLLPTHEAEHVVGHQFHALELKDMKVLKPSIQDNYIKWEGVRYIDCFPEDEIQRIKLYGNPFKPLNIKVWHTDVDLPFKLQENPNEGDYLNFKITFSVPSDSPSDWSKGWFYIYIWGDLDSDGVADDDDIVMWDEYMKIPTNSNPIKVRCCCFYDANNQPTVAEYWIELQNGNYLMPIDLSTPVQPSEYKDDSKYSFANTPEGYTPPWDMYSFKVDENGYIWQMENLSCFNPVKKGQTLTVYGKFYCPIGMTNATKDWYLRILCFDAQYSDVEPIAVHDEHFEVGGGAGGPPVVNVAVDFWVETAILGIVGLICIAIIKVGRKII